MPEQANELKASEGATGAKAEETLIPKEVHEKSLKDKDTTISTLQRTLDDVQSKLLSDEYIEFLASKKSGQPTGKAAEKILTEAGIPESLIAEMRGNKAHISTLENTVRDMAVYLELQEIRSKYPDFNDYNDDVRKILESPDCTLTFEQAYKIAKADRPKDTKAPEPKSSEKPSSKLPASDKIVPVFKNMAEANKHTIDTLRSKYGLTGDTI